MNTREVQISRMELEMNERVEASKQREIALARMAMTYIITGLAFMLLPGTFLGVWNLLSISGTRASASVSPAWIQAHGMPGTRTCPSPRSSQ